MSLFSPDIESEIARLQRVLIHSPGLEFDRMRPENVEPFSMDEDEKIRPNSDYLLFDDLVLLPKLRREHQQLVEVLRAVAGKEGVLDFRGLLQRTLFDSAVRDAIVDAVARSEMDVYGWEMGDAVIAELKSLDPHSLSDALIWGVHPDSGERVCKWPAPNLLFSRDIGAVVGDAMVLSYAARNARKREMLLARHVFQNHPGFKGMPIIDIAEGAAADDPPAYLEGGDVLMLSRKVVAIGVGVRTNPEAVRRLAPRLFERGIEVVLMVSLPRRRAAMHLDTVFTRISENGCLAYMPCLESDEDGADLLKVHVWRSGEPTWSEARENNLLQVLSDEGIDLVPVSCGGTNRDDQAREQWSDGANAFALAPGKIVCYGRNRRTMVELNKAGFEIMRAEDFVRNAEMILSEPNRRVAVTIEGSELSRGRGGPRCLTMAIARE